MRACVRVQGQVLRTVGLRNRGVYQLVIVDARTGRRVVAWTTPGSTFAGTIPAWGPGGVYIGVS